MSASSRRRSPVSCRGESIDHQHSRERQLEARRAGCWKKPKSARHLCRAHFFLPDQAPRNPRRSTVSRTPCYSFTMIDRYVFEIIAPTVCRAGFVQPLQLAHAWQPPGTRLVAAPHHDGTIPHVQCESHVQHTTLTCDTALSLQHILTTLSHCHRIRQHT